MAKLLQRIIDGILPQNCVLCGTALFNQCCLGPLCDSCHSTLKIWTGLRCEICGLPLISEEGRCMRCRTRTWAFDSAYPLFSYSGRVRDLLTAYKKQGRRSLSILFTDLVAKILSAKFPDSIIVPVPPRPGKMSKKGWDQIETIMRGLEQKGFCVLRLLERLSTAEQKQLGREERETNARLSYVLRRGSHPPPRILLFDDIVTTGATINACARALKNGGVEVVNVLVLAAV